jgi:hypothetical protein
VRGLKARLNRRLNFIKQLKATAVFSAFFTGNLFKDLRSICSGSCQQKAESFLPSREAQNHHSWRGNGGLC